MGEPDWERIVADLEARLAEAERDRDEFYSMAVAMFYSGKADDLTAGQIKDAARVIQAKLRASDSAAAQETAGQ